MSVNSIRRDNIRRNRTKVAMGSLAVAITLGAAAYGIYLLARRQTEEPPPDGGGGEAESSSTGTFVGIAVVVVAIVFQIVIFYFRRKIFSVPFARIRTNTKALEGGGESKSLTQKQSDAISDATTRKLTGTKAPKKKRESSVISTGSYGEWQKKNIGDKVEVFGMTHAISSTRKQMFTKDNYEDNMQNVFRSIGRQRQESESVVDGVYAIFGDEGYSLSSNIFKPTETDTVEVVLHQLNLLRRMIEVVDEYLENVVIKGERNVPQIQFIFENDGTHPEREDGTVPGRENDPSKLGPSDKGDLLPLKQRIYVPDTQTLEVIKNLEITRGAPTDSQSKTYKNKIYPNMKFTDHDFNNYVYSDQDKKNILTTVLMTVGAEPFIFTYFAQKVLEYKNRRDLTAEQKKSLQNNIETPLMRPAMGPNAFEYIQRFDKMSKILELAKKLDTSFEKERMMLVVRDPSFKSENEENPVVREVLEEIEKDHVLNGRFYRNDFYSVLTDKTWSGTSDRFLEYLKERMSKKSPRIAFSFYDLYNDPTLSETDRERINNIARDIWAYESLQKYTKNQPKRRNVFIMGSSHNFKNMMKRLGSKIEVEQDKLVYSWIDYLGPKLQKKVTEKIKEYIKNERSRTKEERVLDEAI